MSQQGALSTTFNMALGFSPAIIAILLCGFMEHDKAIYTGCAIGAVASLYFLWKRERHIPRIMLGCTTSILLLLSLAHLFFPCTTPRHLYALTIEISSLIPPAIILLGQKRISDYAERQRRSGKCPMLYQGVEAAIVSARVVLICCGLHLFILLCFALFFPAPGKAGALLLYDLSPAAALLLSILFNQFGIFYFNRIMQQTPFYPVVNTQGDVIGKITATELQRHPDKYITPVIRIAVTVHGMLFLLPRPQDSLSDEGKTDLLLEGYLQYGETLEQGVRKMIQQALPNAPWRNLCFNVKYHYEDKGSNHLIYLFLLDLEDDSILNSRNFSGGKLWTFQQIRENIGKNFFSKRLEQEYEQLKATIYTREKYKES